MKRWVKMFGINLFLGLTMGWMMLAVLSVRADLPVDKTLLTLVGVLFVVMMILTGIVSALVPVIGIKEDEIPDPNDAIVSMVLWIVFSLAFIFLQLF